MSRASIGSLFRDGFAALEHEPALLAAELTWRWCFGISMLAIVLFFIGVFLDGLKVSRADDFLLSTLQPQLLLTALRHIFHGSLSRFLLAQALLSVAITLLWSFAAAVGRAATLRRLVAMLSTDDEAQPAGWNFGSTFLLHLLRAMWAQIAVAIAIFLTVYGFTMAGLERPLIAALVLSFGIGLVGFFGLSLNWYLGVAPLFAIRNGVRAREAIEQALAFSNRQSGRLFAIGLGFWVIRLFWMATVGVAFLAPLNLAGSIGGRWVALLMGLVLLLYFVGADALHLARWGAYVSLLEDDSHSDLAPEPSAEIPPELPAALEIIPLEGLA
jgi:hypothetical protein